MCMALGEVLHRRYLAVVAATRTVAGDLPHDLPLSFLRGLRARISWHRMPPVGS